MNAEEKQAIRIKLDLRCTQWEYWAEVARTDIPRLLDALDVAEREVERLRTQLAISINNNTQNQMSADFEIERLRKALEEIAESKPAYLCEEGSMNDIEMREIARQAIAGEESE
jgi:DNA transposition AAA+ family ATPase